MADSLRDAVKQLPAGPDLDAEVGDILHAPGEYSRSMIDAWRVVEHFANQQGHGTNDRLRWVGPNFKSEDRYRTAEALEVGTPCWCVDVESYGASLIACATTPALAICRAAAFVRRTRLEKQQRRRARLAEQLGRFGGSVVDEVGLDVFRVKLQADLRPTFCRADETIGTLEGISAGGSVLEDRTVLEAFCVLVEADEHGRWQAKTR